MNTETLTPILLFLFPILAGGLVYWLKPAFVLSSDKQFEAWAADRKEEVASKTGTINTYFIVPVFTALAKLLEWTSQIKDEYGRCGARVALYQYFLVALVGLAYVAFQIAMFVLSLVIFWFILRWAFHEDPVEHPNERTVHERPTYIPDEPEPEEPSMLHLAAGKGDVYSGSNWLNEAKIGSVDTDGTIMKGSNWLTKEQVGKLDADGNILQGTSWANEEQVGKVDADGTIYEGSNWANKQQIGRIDEDGNVYEGIGLNERKVGRVDRKKE